MAGVKVTVADKSSTPVLYHLDLVGERRLARFGLALVRRRVPYAGAEFHLWADQTLVRSFSDVLIWYADVSSEDADSAVGL